ncbi:MAG: transcription antitermination factor NusB [Brevinema sp.]
MIKTYPLNPKRLERLLIVQCLQQDDLPSSEEDVKSFVPSLVKYDVQGVYSTLPPEVQRRVIRNAFETISIITTDKENLIVNLSKAIQNRPFSAMFPIDQALLLLGGYELEHNQSEPKIIVKEILICSDTLGNEKAGAYLSGILKTLVAYKENPNFTPSQKPFHERAAGRRPGRIFLKGEGGDRDREREPRRDYGDKPYRDSGERSERRSYGDRDREPRRDYGDKPYRDSGERSERRSYGDRDREPRREFGDKPYRDSGERSERRSYGDRDREPRRDFGARPFNKDNKRRDYRDDNGRKDY